ncbi:MAG TPA: Gfo/Idh/MocA family oxidoreductase [Limnochordia bacterium]
MQRPVRLGVVGLGSVAQRGLLPHLTEPDLKPLVELVAVCDAVADRARATAAKYGVPRWYSEYAEMLADDALEAVVIATPIPLHFEQAMAAVRAGKHVHLNKAMTTTKEEADRLLAAAKDAGVKLVASPGQMLRPAYRTVRRLVSEGAVGKVFFAIHGMSFVGHEHEGFRRGDDVLSDVDPAWYYQRGGGPMYDMGVYCLHAITGILGPVRRVTGMSALALPEREFKGRRLSVEMDDNTLLLLDFGQGTFAYIYATNSYGGTGLSVYGERGAIVARRRSGVELNGQDVAVDGSMPYHWGRHPELPEAHVYSDIMHLVDCIRTDREPVVSGEHARHVIEVIEKGYVAARTGQTQEIASTFASPPEISAWGPLAAPEGAGDR